jgi:2,4-dienoyl-CoA reductase-like NADH-dependent reductase (Old Yellow Enzyme family)
MLIISNLLEEIGVDAIELSGGTVDSGLYNHARKGRIDIPDKEVYYKEAARLYKEKINVPLILVGGIRSYETAERLINEGLTDYVSMSRPFIREPNLVNRWKSGDIRPSACLSDNLCYGPIRSGQGIQCVTKNKETEV